jgi:hypothetical protein
MAENKNAALRIKNLLSEAQGNQGASTVEVWKKIFDVDEPNANLAQFAISQKLHLLHEEVEILRMQMRETEFTSTLYSPYLDRCNNIVGVHTLSSTWESYRKQISPEVMLCLSFCSEILPADENEIPAEELSEIESSLSELITLLETSNIPPYTQRIVKKHIEKIQNALGSYKIKGAVVFNEVVQSAYGEVIDSSSVFEESKGKPEISKLGEVWQKIKKVSDAAVVVDKGVSAIGRISEHTSKAIEFIQNMS